VQVTTVDAAQTASALRYVRQGSLIFAIALGLASGLGLGPPLSAAADLGR